jgi:hypothetical protein
MVAIIVILIGLFLFTFLIHKLNQLYLLLLQLMAIVKLLYTIIENQNGKNQSKKTEGKKTQTCSCGNGGCAPNNTTD